MKTTHPTNHSIAALVAIAALALASQSASAQDTGNYRVRLGVGHVSFSESATLKVGGSAVPDASATFSNNTTAMVELGYRFDPNWSANLAFGIPPKTTARGTGNAAPFDRLGAVTYGPLALTAQHQWQVTDAFQPYVGAGVAYNVIFKESDGALSDMKVRNSFGSVLQAGLEYRISPTYALFVDVKKVWLKTKASGNLSALGGAPAKADLTLNPLVVTAGISINF